MRKADFKKLFKASKLKQVLPFKNFSKKFQTFLTANPVKSVLTVCLQVLSSFHPDL